MKKLIVTILIFACACVNETTDKPTIDPNSEGEIRWIEYDKFGVVDLDSCEYIVANTTHGGFDITHKGNCKYCQLRK